MRAVEVYNAEQTMDDGQKPLEVTILRYEDSAELYQNMCAIQQEKIGFVDLIDWKKKLIVDLPDSQPDSLTSLQPILHKEIELSKRDILIVDTREFSCTTPIFLHEKGFWLVPMVITVGDYILSDQICVERKSVATGDLFSSFSSGRLLQQVTNMERFFERPILLIEFDENIEFKINDPFAQAALGNGMSSAASGGDISPASIISKLSLLTLHFKKLQIIWSKSPQHTADIFRAIKDLPENKNNDPDLQKIARTGKLGMDDEDADDSDDEFNRFMPVEFLKRVPGLDSGKITELAKKGRQHGIRTIVDLCQTDEETLGKIIGRNQARDVIEFFTKKVDFNEL